MLPTALVLICDATNCVSMPDWAVLRMASRWCLAVTWVISWARMPASSASSAQRSISPLVTNT